MPLASTFAASSRPACTRRAWIVRAAMLAACAAAGGWCCLAAGAGDDSPSQEAVVVTLRAAAVVAEGEVRIAHIADLDGGDAALRRRIGGLDLADAPGERQQVQLSREHVTYRIELAGIEGGRFRVQGAERVTVGAGGCEIAERELLAAAREHLQERLECEPDDLELVLLTPLRAPLRVPHPRDVLSLEASLPADRPPTGRVRVNVAVLKDETRVASAALDLEVRYFRAVAVTARRIEAQEAFTADNLRFERRRVDPQGDHYGQAQPPLGKVARRALPARHVLAAGDVQAAAADPLLVSQREMVQLVARLGRLRVTTVGEALQSGRAGQLIRVRNIDSKNVVLGRVAGRGLVEVLY